MSEKYRTIFVDLLTISLAWALYYWIRIESGWFTYPVAPDFWLPMAIVDAYWVIVFFLFGMYRSWYAQSRFDELATLFKASVFGTLVLFFAIFVDDAGAGSPLLARLLILIYWALITGCVGAGRLLQHTFQRRLLEAGIGLRNTLIVGSTDKARELARRIERYPALGYKIVGFIQEQPSVVVRTSGDGNGLEVVGDIPALPEAIDRLGARDVIIAVDSSNHEKLLEVIACCDGYPVNLKIVPDLYDIISGQARTNQIYGFPLIEIMPELMQPWERAVKRMMDVVISTLVLAIGAPGWLFTALLIKLDSPGTVFYRQERVGKDGKVFKIYKFRSMTEDAEKNSGPVWAGKQDARVTRVGKLLRSTRVDEVPQFINVLRGEMSLVGPRPERAYFVEILSKEIPLYTRRLKVRPGITGWAQVKHKYDESIDDVRKKVQYDLYYIENMSLRMDLKILLSTLYVVFLGKGH